MRENLFYVAGFGKHGTKRTNERQYTFFKFPPGL